MKILVTGAAGFIGYHVCKSLSELNTVIGIDNYSTYYNINLKKDRITTLASLNIPSASLNISSAFSFVHMTIINIEALDLLFKKEKFDIVIHLAAQAGVRYSIEHPRLYIETNLVGTANLLELCRQHDIKHFVYASSSSVYGRNTKIPFSEDDPVRLPSNLYAVTKRSIELMAESYTYLHKLPTTGLRFFTVYGPWGRPDMAYYKFTELLYSNQPIPLFNKGKHRRDMTYVDDIIEGILAVVDGKPEGSHIYNLGNNTPVELWTLVHELERLTERKAIIQEMPFQEGDVLETYANIELAHKDFGYQPRVQLAEGLGYFIDWYKWYRKANGKLYS